MIRALTFTKDWRCFRAGNRFDFRPGVNLLVGDQGCGKSSLIQAIHIGGCTGRNFGSDKEMRKCVQIEASPVKMYKFDFEKDNPRIQSGLGENALFQIHLIHICIAKDTIGQPRSMAQQIANRHSPPRFDRRP